MNNFTFGIIAGLLFAVGEVAFLVSVKPVEKPNKKAIYITTFLCNLAIGFLIPVLNLGVHPIAAGLAVALILSIPKAIVSKSYVYPFVIAVMVGVIIGGWINYIGL
jgi:hypothetical protein